MNTPNTFTKQLNNDFLATIENEDLNASLLSLDEINEFIENLDH